MAGDRVERSHLPEDRLVQPVTMKWLAAVLGGSLLYSVVRYHVVQDVPWSDFPLFVFNKALSLSAVILVAGSYLVGPVIRWHNHDAQIRLVVVKFCGLIGFSMAFVHAFYAVCLLSPAYFARFFLENGRLTLPAELGLSVGVVALWALALPAITTLPMMAKAIGGIRWKRNQRMGYTSLFLVIGHMVFFGWKGWMKPALWPGGLPPISLIATLVALVPLLVKLRRERGK